MVLLHVAFDHKMAINLIKWKDISMNILVSACLLGVHCRYNGKGIYLDKMDMLKKDHNLVPVCPEIMGGLPTPRCPAERLHTKVVTKEGTDVTTQFERGASETLELAKRLDCSLAILKERSPSCGKGAIYDGTFTSALIPGDGVTTHLLEKHGIQVIGESKLLAEKIRGI